MFGDMMRTTEDGPQEEKDERKTDDKIKTDR